MADHVAALVELAPVGPSHLEALVHRDPERLRPANDK